MTEELEQVYEKLTYCFENRKFADLRMTLIDMEPFDIATFMEENLDEKEELMFFRLLPKDCASDVFVEIDTDTQERLIKAFTDKELKAVVDDMFLTKSMPTAAGSKMLDGFMSLFDAEVIESNVTYS